ncbi:unnamed protein product [Rotaria magnacalcarata]|uniref:Uncharacterized protein n=1 Tax=Rotaria magnacalcarata TaxID=392030 RepID=A0A816UV02_9BILA|nr:unnamed protein product [Rotaria magnacalcarata]CAF2137023.1 unnamed protein product [Rotaria magnacalcarata]CAF3924841.1 unnamed protein product [Rotaria magnacalcarata]CAF3987690.1 unnamed protein product [Rotaria magnacalcarata]
MGNSRSSYERHEDDEQQQRIVIGKEFRLILGQLHLSSDLVKRKKTLSHHKQSFPRKVSLSSSNSTITSSSSCDHHNSSFYCIQLDIPTTPFEPNEIDTHALLQYLLLQDSYGKELTHIFKIPVNLANNNQKSQSKTLPTLKIAAVYYDQSSSTTTTTTTASEFYIETVSLLSESELEEKIEEFNEKHILCIYTSKLKAHIIYGKKLMLGNRYKLTRSTTMSKTILENFEWLHPFINYSNLGYRLCGIIPLVNSSLDTSFTIYWLFEQIDTNETIQYDYCIIEYQLKSSSLNSWTSLLNLMSKQEWRLVATFDYNQKKKNGEQTYFLLFFQRIKN